MVVRQPDAGDRLPLVLAEDLQLVLLPSRPAAADLAPDDRLEILRKNAWTPVGRQRLTNDHGVFMWTIRLKRGALLRVWSPRQRRYSLQLRVR